MKRYTLLGYIILSAAIFVLMKQNTAIRRNNERLQRNNTVLSTGLESYRTTLEQSAAHVGTLEMTIKELRQLNDELLQRIEQMKIKPRRVESVSINAINTSFSFTIPLSSGTISRSNTAPRPFRWENPWNKVDGVVGSDSVECSIVHRDTLDQVIYRVPRRFLFIRWGTKEIRQAVSVRDPKSTIVYSEYVVLKRER